MNCTISVIVGVLVVNRDGNILLGCGRRMSGRYVIVGGHLELGETLSDCAKREVFEETGLTIDEPVFLTIEESIFSEEINSQKHYVCINFMASTSGSATTPSDEFEKLVWMPPEAAIFENVNETTRRCIRKFLELRR